MQIILIVFIFFKILTYIIFFDVILSWLTMFWLKIRPQFLADIIDPIYKSIKKILPTTMWPIDFTPIVVIITMVFIQWLLINFFPEISNQAINLMK